MMREILMKALESKLALAVLNQIKLGVPCVPKEDADDLLLKVAQLPHDRVRGLIVIAALDVEHPERGSGLDVQTYALGTSATLDPLLELGCHQLDARLTSLEDVCPDCGQSHGGEDFVDQLTRRGPGATNVMDLGALQSGSLLHALIEGLARSRGMR